jgi:hypothetical protein
MNKSFSSPTSQASSSQIPDHVYWKVNPQPSPSQISDNVLSPQPRPYPFSELRLLTKMKHISHGEDIPIVLDRVQTEIKVLDRHQDQLFSLLCMLHVHTEDLHIFLASHFTKPLDHIQITQPLSVLIKQIHGLIPTVHETAHHFDEAVQSYVFEHEINQDKLDCIHLIEAKCTQAKNDLLKSQDRVKSLESDLEKLQACVQSLEADLAKKQKQLEGLGNYIFQSCMAIEVHYDLEPNDPN